MDNIFVNTRSSIKITGTKAIYFDPLEIVGEPHDADMVFITHEHYDHFSPDDIRKVIKEDSKMIVPEVMIELVREKGFGVADIYGMNPFQKDNFDGAKCQGIPAYNIGKPFHPRNNDWLGYLVELDGTTYYAMGDTDVTEEAKAAEADVVFVPIGGKYTMDAAEAAEYINAKQPRLVVPIHYGDASVCETFKSLIGIEQKCEVFW